MTKEFFVIKNGKGLIVQTWNFAPKPFINYCKSPEWVCHKGGVICISEVIDISPGNLDSILCFIR